MKKWLKENWIMLILCIIFILFMCVGIPLILDNIINH